MTPQFYLVGGAVRDHLLGRESKDRDYVVVGATPEWMLENGYSQVGKDFPVYLKDGCEYALARQERKTAPGYNGFETKHDTSVTLEDDLLRRDLTINSMAMTDNGMIIDPHGGMKDLEDRILRHTSEAFAEDPIRVMRVARFAARYGFEVHPETIELCKKIVHELNNVPKERIWMELSKGLTEPNPAKMLRVLHEVGAMDGPLDAYFPENDAFVDWLDTIFTALNATGVDLSVETKFLLCFDGLSTIEDLDSLVQKLSIPKNYTQMLAHSCILTFYLDNCLIASNEAVDILDRTRYNAQSPSAEHTAIVRMMQIQDGFTKYKSAFRENLERLNTAWYAIKSVDLKAVAEGDKSTVKQRIFDAKEEAVRKAFTNLENT